MSNYSRLSEVSTTCYSNGELHRIQVQILLRGGMPKFDVIGLPQNMIREGKDRILAALSTLGIELPQQKILVSLNPGDILKEGSHFDLPVLIAILKALGIYISHPTDENPAEFFWGELNLDGTIRPCDDILAHLLYANQFRPTKLLSGGKNNELSFLNSYLHSKHESISHVSELLLPKSDDAKNFSDETAQLLTDENLKKNWIDDEALSSRWNQLQGTESQFLLMSLCALGRHHLFLQGPPGTGKSSWCFALKETQFPLSPNKWGERFWFAPKLSKEMKNLKKLCEAPFENPHHTSSKTSIVGGGSNKVAAGAITRANRGILFLDEVAEFNRDVLESLREPLENKTITLARSDIVRTLPADVQVLAAMNPCRCGCSGSTRICTCTTTEYYAYQGRISEPLRDRLHFNIWWEFIGEKRKKNFELREVKERLWCARSGKKPIFSGIEIPRKNNLRRERLWIEVFESWCRWFEIEYPTQKNVSDFCNLLTEMENTYEPDQHRSEYEPIRSGKIH